MRRFKYCVIIIFHPYYSHALYLDSGRDVRKDYTDVKSVLDKALSSFIAVVGVKNLKFDKKVKGCHVSNHVTNFPCLKQSAYDNGVDAWFAILQMRAIVKYEQDLLLPTSLQKRFTRTRDTTDAQVRSEFRAIQLRLATILWRDVLQADGLFHSQMVPMKNEIESRLESGCDERTFNTLEGVRPFPPRKT